MIHIQMKIRLFQIFLAVVLDIIVGDPLNLPHPVRWVGSLISYLENRIYPRNFKYAGGIFLVIITIVVSLSLTYLLLHFFKYIHPFLSIIVGSLIIFYSLSFKSLRESALSVKYFLEQGKLENARREVGKIVGRDTDELNSSEIVRATIESVAENASDGVIAPLFYALFGGPILSFLYRVVNTLDSMVGYRSERYRYFGWASARLDDFLNLLPSRITAFLFIMAGVFYRRSPLAVAKIVFRDARKHKSPNAGFPEAAMAGLLKVRLGGVNYYQGKCVKHNYLGDPLEPLTIEKIGETLKYFSLSYLIFLCLLLALSWRF